MEAGVKKCFTT